MMAAKTDRERTASRRKSASARQRQSGALRLLKDDHARVRSMFDKFEKMESGQQKQELAQMICHELKVHAQLEEEIFYPAVRKAIEDEDLMNEADVEHASAKQLIAEIESADAADPAAGHFDALVTVLGEYVKHHVKEEEGEMFKQIRKSDLDLEALGETMKEFKEASMMRV
jgi:hemerythrin superfamily protein